MGPQEESLMNKKKGIIIAAAAAVVLVAVLLILIFVPKGGSDEGTASIDEPAKLSVSTDKDGLHQANVQTDKDGKIAANGYGTLLEYYPADIKAILITGFYLRQSNSLYSCAAVIQHGKLLGIGNYGAHVRVTAV